MRSEAIFFGWIIKPIWEHETVSPLTILKKPWTTGLQVVNIHESFLTTIINERSWLKGGIYIYIYIPQGNSRWRSQTEISNSNFMMQHHWNWNTRPFSNSVLDWDWLTNFPLNPNEHKQLNNRTFKKVFLALLLLNSPTQVVCQQD